MGKGECSKRKAQSKTKNYPDFFKVFLSMHTSRKMPIPKKFSALTNDSMPKKAFLRHNGETWNIKIRKAAGTVCFQEGWENFAKCNNLQTGDFLVFSYDGGSMFDVEIFGNSKCVKEQAGDRVLPEINEAIKEEGQEYEDEDYVIINESEEADHNEDKEEDHDCVPNDEGNAERVYITRDEDADEHINNVTDEDNDSDGDDQNNEEEWESARRYLTNERNPFFFTKLRSGPKKQLYVPVEVIRVFGLELPETMFFIDPHGKKWKAHVRKWTDGRIWIDGWMQLCKWNLVTRQHTCICEFVEGTNYIQVHIC